jgi:hypothetical protein
MMIVPTIGGKILIDKPVLSGQNFDELDGYRALFERRNIFNSTFKRACLNGSFFGECDAHGADFLMLHYRDPDTSKPGKWNVFGNSLGDIY